MSAKVDRQVSLDELACPKCGSTDVRRSRSDDVWSAIQRMFRRWPFRCRSCRARFYRVADPPPDDD